MLPHVITSPPNDKEVSDPNRKKGASDGPEATSDDEDLICGCLGCTNPAYARVRHPKHGALVVCSDGSCRRDYDILEVL